MKSGGDTHQPGLTGVEWRDECTNDGREARWASGRGEPVAGWHRAVMLRAAAAALALGAAVGAHTEVGNALAKRAAERAERDAVACAEAARWDAADRAAHPHHESRADLLDTARPPSCR